MVLKAGIDADPGQVSAGLAGLVRAQIGAIAALRRADVTAALPKTRSGKTLRKTKRGIASGNASEPAPTAIDDVAALDAMRPVPRECCTTSSGSAQPRNRTGEAPGRHR